jgi:hypothetical protein
MQHFNFDAEFATAGLVLTRDVMTMNCIILSLPKGEKFGPYDCQGASHPPSAGIKLRYNFSVLYIGVLFNAPLC